MLNPVLILAAGKSSRMGTPKGLLSWQGKAWVIEQLKNLKNSSVSHVTLVLGHHIHEYFEAIPECREALETETQFQGLSVSLTVNPSPENGPFSSIQHGLRFIQRLDSRSPQSSKAVFVLPIDVPCPSPEAWTQIRTEYIRNMDRIDVVIPRYENRNGHPVLISQRFQNHLIELDRENPESRLDYQIRFLDSAKKLYVPVEDSKILKNFNTPYEWSQEVQLKAEQSASLISNKLPLHRESPIKPEL